MPAHILLAAFLATPPTVAPIPKEPAVHATIPVEKKCIASGVQFSPDGKTLAFIESNQVVLWDVAKKERTAFKTKGGHRQMVWSPDSKTIYTANFGGVFRVDVATGKMAELYGHDAIALKYLPDTDQVVSASVGGSIVVWDAAKNKQVKKLKCPQDGLVMDVQPVPGTAKLAVIASCPTIQIGGPKGIILHGISESTTQKVLESAKEGKQVVLCSHKVLYLAGLIDGMFTAAVDDPPVSDDERPLAAPHAGGEYALADPDKGVVITDATTGKSRVIDDCPIRPLACRFSPSDHYLFVGGCAKDNRVFNVLKGAIAVYDLTAEKWVGQWATKGTAVYDLSYSAPTNLLTGTSGVLPDRQITVWDMKGIVDPTAKKEKKD